MSEYSMSQSPSAKRKRQGHDSKPEPSSKRKIRSCVTCRRLKTRCEIKPDSIACHRCGILKLECSLDGSDAFLDTVDQSPRTQDQDHQATRPSDRSLEDRLQAVENGLGHVRASLDELLRLSLNPQETIPRPKTNKLTSTPVITRSSTPQTNGNLVADRNSRTAPASLIREMKHYILGEERDWHESDAYEDIVTKGVITEDMTNTLLVGFSKLSRRWLFMKSNPSTLRHISSVLFASSVLAGLQIDPSLHATQLHHDLYQHVSGLLSRTMLTSPLSLEAIQSMLIFSMWNLVPDKLTEHLDPWLLSGVAGMQGMLAINFEDLLKPRPDGLVDPRSRETFRTWNLICLCHLHFIHDPADIGQRFSVGTGRPPVLSRQYLKQCKNILSLPSYNSRDQLVAFGVELYDSLCSLVNSETVQTDSLVWVDIDNWKKRCGQFFELDSTKPLRFAYSCSYLILTRRTLKYLSEQPTQDNRKRTNSTYLDPSLYFRLAVEHAHRILHLFLAMSDLTAFVRPAYENLLCSFAMVTLSEFASYMDDIDATLALMERTSQHVQLGGKAEPVSKWALGVMRKFVFDTNKRPDSDSETEKITSSSPKQRLGGSSASASVLPVEFEASDWGLGDAAYQDFPSLEEMFLGN